MTIYLSRHGTTAWNRANMIQGHTDIPLDGDGVNIAHMCSDKLHEEGIVFKYVFSSPLLRTRETARILAPYADAVTDERLTEFCFGEFEGRDIKEMLNDENCTFRFFKKDPVRYDEEIGKIIEEARANPSEYSGKALPETIKALYERSSSFIREVVEPIIRSENDPECNILISGHGAMNRALLMYFNGTADLKDYWANGVQANCGIAKIECKKDDADNIVYTVINPCVLYYDPALIPKYPM